MTGDVGGTRRLRWLLVAAVAIPIALGPIPLLLSIVRTPDAPAPSWIAPYVDLARQSLLNNDDFGGPQFRYVGARCSGEAVALLFERRSYPYVTHTGSIAMTESWPPDGAGSFSGSLFVDDFDQGLRDGWDPDRIWLWCEGTTYRPRHQS